MLFAASDTPRRPPNTPYRHWINWTGNRAQFLPRREFHCHTLANALSLLLKNAPRHVRTSAYIEGRVSAMFLRPSALLLGSAVAAASALSIVNANSSALKEPATGIGECCVHILQKLRPSMSCAQLLKQFHDRVRITARGQNAVGCGCEAEEGPCLCDVLT